MSELTVGDVLKRFKQEGSGTALKEALASVGKTPSTTPLNNDSYADALPLSEAMFLRANRSIDILTAGGCDKFLEALSDSFNGALRRIKKVGGTVRIILLDSTDKLKVDPQFDGTIKYAFARVEGDPKASNIRHLIICDDNMLRDEEPHAPLTLNSAASEIKADVYLNSTVHAKMKKEYFNSLWERLTGGQ